ncbi:glycoside hydrolase family 3 C-terminal domain-containing protein, partial [Chloroflexota bacterium]
ALALKAAHESMVLLKNAGNLLPLDRATLKSIAVIGPNADSVNVLLSNYYGIPSQPITPLAGLRAAVGPDTEVYYAQGSTITGEIKGPGITSAVDVAKRADVAVLVLGISQQLEGEEGQEEGNAPGIKSLGDRAGLGLPEVQQRLLEAVHATGTPVVLVLMNGSPVTVNWADENVPAIIEAWYPGQAGGTALADVLLGDYNPGGRLPVTIYRSLDDLPPFKDYDMYKGRTYRFFQGDPLYAFGYGLSYTTFAYSDLQITSVGATGGSPAPEPSITAGDSVTVNVTVTNTGDRAGDEVVQVYLRPLAASVPAPLRQLVGFKRVHLAPGARETISFAVGADQMALYDDAGHPFVDAGTYEIAVGGQQPDAGAATTAVVKGKFTVTV